MVGAVVQVGAHHDVRYVPGRWCGAHPPYEGTLYIGASYGLPFAWLGVGRYERCTTSAPLFDDVEIYGPGLMLNLATYGVLVYLINYNLRRGGRPEH